MKKPLIIGWLYPELMATYGDRGNILILAGRLKRRNIPVHVLPINMSSTAEDLKSCNLIVGGGAQDRQQSIVITDLRARFKDILADMFDRGIPGLFVCGSPQLLGHWYMNGDGNMLQGLGIFDLTTKHFGKNKPRLIGNTVGKISTDFQLAGLEWKDTIVGFENHGGRTYLGPECQSFATVVRGNGNNGEDRTEGAKYKNCIATYYHGPFLSKNPHIADWLLVKAYEVKTGHVLKLKPLHDTYEWKAHNYILQRLKI